jgi:hypothetical protein
MQPRAVGIDDVALEAAHHGVADRGRIRCDAAGEPLVIEDFQQS